MRLNPKLNNMEIEIEMPEGITFADMLYDFSYEAQNVYWPGGAEVTNITQFATEFKRIKLYDYESSDFPIYLDIIGYGDESYGRVMYQAQAPCRINGASNGLIRVTFDDNDDGTFTVHIRKEGILYKRTVALEINSETGYPRIYFDIYAQTPNNLLNQNLFANGIKGFIIKMRDQSKLISGTYNPERPYIPCRYENVRGSGASMNVQLTYGMFHCEDDLSDWAPQTSANVELLDFNDGQDYEFDWESLVRGHTSSEVVTRVF